MPKVTWCPYDCGLIMVVSHQNSCEEGKAMHLHPPKAEILWHGPSDPHEISQLHH